MEIIKFFFPEIYLSFTSLLILLLLSFISLNPSSQFFLWLINLFISFCLLVSNYNINYFISSEYFIGDLAHYYLRLVIFFFGFLLYFSLKNILFKESLINEFSLLFVLVLAFSSILLSSSNLLVAFVLIETISLSLYLLVSFYKKNLLSLEAGLKYFLFGTMASLFLFLGIFFIYYSTSEFSLSKLLAISYEKNTLFYLGFLLIFIGIVFKLGGVPFHFWAPEVYQGAPTMVFPLLILISKFSFAVFLINLVYYLIKINTAYPLNLSFFQNFFYLISLLSMILGNLLALKQKEIKRLLTYSSIAHIGYLLSLFTLPWNSSNLQIFLGYLFIYTLTLLGVNIILLIILQKNKNLVKIEIPSLELYLKDKNILLVLSFLIFIFS
ncbi:MAG: NADH-quinone oxidoreductase subunit N, partial [Caldimicrobium sp.]